MRFSVGYNVKRIDVAYRMHVYSLIKEAISIADKDYYERIFVQSERKIKPFTYSAYLRNFTIEHFDILLDEIIISISSPDMEFAVHCFNGLQKLKEHRVGKDIWVQSHLRLLNEHSITSRKVVYQTLSPILIENREGKPLAPNNLDYEKELNYYANLQVLQFAGRNLYEPLHFQSIDLKKQVIRERNRHMNPDTFLYFTAYKGIFSLEGNPQDLQLLYQLGLGKRNAYFGMLDYLREEV